MTVLSMSAYAHKDDQTDAALRMSSWEVNWKSHGEVMPQLTIFYDGTCPLCSKEMAALTKQDTDNHIKTVDIYSEEFADYPNIDANAANTVLHALDSQGQLILGLDVTHKAWDLVGKGWLYAPLRWPIIKPLADWCYLRFANNRYKISYWLTGVARCDSNGCDIGNKSNSKG